jgi:hypothetical protein
MRLLRTLKGNGNVIARSGKTPVEYELGIYQKEIPVRMMGSNSTIPGMQELRGWIRPFCSAVGEMQTLELKDGSTVSFWFADSLGSVSFSGGITPAASHV